MLKSALNVNAEHESRFVKLVLVEFHCMQISHEDIS